MSRAIESVKFVHAVQIPWQGNRMVGFLTSSEAKLEVWGGGVKITDLATEAALFVPHANIIQVTWMT